MLNAVLNNNKKIKTHGLTRVMGLGVSPVPNSTPDSFIQQMLIGHPLRLGPILGPRDTVVMRRYHQIVTAREFRTGRRKPRPEGTRLCQGKGRGLWESGGGAYPSLR